MKQKHSFRLIIFQKDDGVKNRTNIFGNIYENIGNPRYRGHINILYYTLFYTNIYFKIAIRNNKWFSNKMCAGWKIITEGRENDYDDDNDDDKNNKIRDRRGKPIKKSLRREA